MIWSKLKKRIEALFAPTMFGRVELRSTRFRHAHDRAGRGYITVDGKEVWQMSTPQTWTMGAQRVSEAIMQTGESLWTAWPRVYADLENEGVFEQETFYQALEDYLNSTVEDNLRAANPLRRALAMLDRRIGQRRLASMDVSGEHPMVRYFHELRTSARHSKA